MAKERFNFKKAYEELQKITEEFERGDVELDEGLEKFRYALALAAKLKEHLSETENDIKVIKKKFNGIIEKSSIDEDAG